MKPKLILCLALVLGGGLFGGSSIAQSVNVADIKITFTTPSVAPLHELPREVLYPQGFDSIEHGAFTNLVAGHIAALTVTWADSKIFKTESQTRDFLSELLSSPNTQTWEYHAWSYLDGSPTIVATVGHTTGKQGKWIIWTSPNVVWAYQDGSGKWWWGMWNSLKSPKPKSLNSP